MAKKVVTQVWNQEQVQMLVKTLVEPGMKDKTQAEFVAAVQKAVGKNAVGKVFDEKRIVSKARLVRKKFTKLGYSIPDIPRKESSTALLSDATVKSLASELGLKKL